MSQTLQFHKLKFYTKEATESFLVKNIYESIKALFQDIPAREYEDYLEVWFESIYPEYLVIDIKELEKLSPNIFESLTYYILDLSKKTFVMMEPKLWNEIDLLVKNRIEECLINHEDSVERNLQQTGKIIRDYEILKTLFTEKLLFVSII